MSWESNYYNAIVILRGGIAAKYHNVPVNKTERFQAFVKKKFPSVDHINYYPKHGGRCLKSVKI